MSETNETDCFLFIKMDNKWAFFEHYKKEKEAVRHGDIIINKKMADEYIVINTEEIIENYERKTK
jgi:hypothetical protein